MQTILVEKLMHWLTRVDAEHLLHHPRWVEQVAACTDADALIACIMHIERLEEKVPY